MIVQFKSDFIFKLQILEVEEKYFEVNASHKNYFRH